MKKFILDTEEMSTKIGELMQLSNRIGDVLTSVEGFNIETNEFDFGSAINAIRNNIEGVEYKIRRTGEIFNNVLDTHSSLQNSLKYDYNTNSLNTSQQNGIYTVSKGETLSEIAEKTNSSVSDIANLNNIENINLILAGQSLVIPGSNKTTKQNNTNVTQNVDSNNENIDNSNNNKNNVDSNLINTEKYLSNSEKGFMVTANNKTYNLSQKDKELLMAIVSAEADKSSKDDCLAVISVILNRCEDSRWVASHGNNPISQATAPNQFVVYQNKTYEKYLNGNVNENVKKAVEDALNGLRNCKYLSFRSNSSTSYSDNMIVSSGNRYA